MMQQHARKALFRFSFKSKIIILLIAFVLSGCVQFPKKSGHNKLRPLCEKDAGLTIHKTVKAKGYFDPKGYTGYSRQIIFNNFEFVEFCTEKPSKTGPFYSADCWRVSKVDRSEDRCSEEIDRRLGRKLDKAYAHFLENSCFSVEKIEKPRSRYSYITRSDSWYGQNNVSKFRRTESHILDNKTNKSVADYITYSFTARPGLDPYIFCDDVDSKYVSMRDTVFVNSVILPQI